MQTHGGKRRKESSNEVFKNFLIRIIFEAFPRFLHFQFNTSKQKIKFFFS
jgi:hypothetical protein